MAEREDFDELLPNEQPLTPEEMQIVSDRQILGDADGEVIEIEDAPAPVGRSIAYDFERNQAVMAGHGPLVIRGEQTVYGWIEKALRTAEGAHAVHPPGYGLMRPIEDYLGEEVFDENGMVEDITRAILFHPSITSVEDVVVTVLDDEDEAYGRIYISLTASLDDESEVEFGTALEPVGEVLI